MVWPKLTLTVPLVVKLVLMLANCDICFKIKSRWSINSGGCLATVRFLANCLFTSAN